MEVRAPNHFELKEQYTRKEGESVEVLAELRRRELQISRSEQDPLAASHLPSAAAETPQQGSRSLRTAGLVSAGVGIASLLGGGYYTARVNTLSDEARNAPAFDPARSERLDSAETRQYVLLSVGLVAIVVGGVMYWIGAK